MKSIYKILLSTTILAFGKQSYSQESTIGISFIATPATFSYAKNSVDNLIVNYKLNTKDNYSLTAGIAIGADDDLRHGDVVKWTNLVRMKRTRTRFNKNVNLRFGANKQLNQSPFSIGLNATLGWARTNFYSFNSGSFFDIEDSRWLTVGISSKPTQDFEVGEYRSDITHLKVDYLRAGITPTVSVEVPINSKLNFHSFGGVYAGLKTNLWADGSESPNPVFEPQPLTVTTFEINLRFGVGIYYKLGGKS